jgi:very-short-patch-repair endonuclease
MQWIRRYLDFDPAEPSPAAVRDAESTDDVETLCRTLCESFNPPIGVTLSDSNITAIPTRAALAGQPQPTLLSAGLIGLIQWENQELIRDLETLRTKEEIGGAADDFLREAVRRPSLSIAPPDDVDRYLVTDTDLSQERAVWMARTDSGVVVHGPPGTGKSQVIVNIIADSLAHNRTVLVVCQKKAALDVVASRLTAAGLNDLFVQIDDAEADRRRVIETLKAQEKPTIIGIDEERKHLASKIERLERDLEDYRKALFDIRHARGISFRRMVGRISNLRRMMPETFPSSTLQNVLAPLNYEEVQRLCSLFRDIERVFHEADPLKSPWQFAQQNLSGDPYERREITGDLKTLATLAEKADRWTGATSPTGYQLIGDCRRIAEAASAMDKGLRALNPSLLTPPKHQRGSLPAPLSDSAMEQGARAISSLVRWQFSFFKLFTLPYYLAGYRWAAFTRTNPWILQRDATNQLNEIERRALTASAILDNLQRLKRWLEDQFIEDVYLKVLRAESLLPIVTQLIDYLDRLPPLLQYRAMITGLATTERQVLDAIISGEQEPSRDWPEKIEVSALLSWIAEAERESPILRRMSRDLYDARKKELDIALSRKRELESKAISSNWAKKWDGVNLQWRKSLALKGKTSRRLREIVELWGDKGLTILRPCWLTNPGTASQIFPLKPGLFDIVIFDEASQCPPEYAVAALCRGRRAVVAGDTKQLPPTMFFKSTFDFEGEDDEEQENGNQSAVREKHEVGVATGAEDLLNLAQARLPEVHLNVHYRSRHSVLISFSNAAFYGNRLETPQPAKSLTTDGEPALFLQRVDGRYMQNRTNPQEAHGIVQYLHSLWGRPGTPPTVGVVTFNEPQQQAILDHLDDLARKDIAFRIAYERELARTEAGQDVGFFVKNLEAVQGDERDVMLFSTTYGHRDDRPFSRAFLGPLNREGGERRLNVAISRAKLWVRIFTSLPIDQIAEALSPDAIPSGDAIGRSMLQLYLAYADHITRGDREAAETILARALHLGGQGIRQAEVGTEESEFEIEVGDRIRTELGYQVDPQVGSGAFRIDLGIRHPDDKSYYILGVECDGKAYHSAPAARAYDLWRQRILEERGWRIHRIWSTAWRQDPEAEIAKIEDMIKRALGEKAQPLRREIPKEAQVSKEAANKTEKAQETMMAGPKNSENPGKQTNLVQEELVLERGEGNTVFHQQKASTWYKLYEWAKRLGHFKETERSLILKMARAIDRKTNISPAEEKRARELYKKAIWKGFSP